MAKEKTEQAAKDGSNYSYGGIVCGVISFFILGIILAPIAIILGARGYSKGDKTKGIIAIVIGIIGLAFNIMALAALSAMGIV